MNSLALYLTNQEQTKLIPGLLNCDKISPQHYRDIFLVADNDVCYYGLGKISTFYLGFSAVDIVFMSLEDLMGHRHLIPAKRTYVISSTQEILDKQLTKRDLEGIEVIELCNTPN